MCQCIKKRIASQFLYIRQVAKLLKASNTLPSSVEALSFLEKISPNMGGSCWTDAEAVYPVRDVTLSVIVTAYNTEAFIARCLESIVQQQASFDYEIIVIDDGSTDQTGALVEQYAHHKQLRIIHQENRGLSAARNAGVQCAKGKYLCFVDADDALPEGALQSLVTAAQRENAKLVAGSYERCLPDGSTAYTYGGQNGPVQNQYLPGFAWGKIFHYSVFRNIRFPEGYWFEDSVMAQIIHPVCQNATYMISDNCYRYYVNAEGITQKSPKSVKSIDSLWITMRLLEERKKFDLPYTQSAYEYFLSMVNLTYQRTKLLGADVAKSIFVVQQMLLDRYYSTYKSSSNKKKKKIEEALRTMNFRKYVLACSFKR